MGLFEKGLKVEVKVGDRARMNNEISGEDTELTSEDSAFLYDWLRRAEKRGRRLS